ncbi:DUF4163 domain-containing protein [Paenibacillus sp. N4]|uniref:DUF4163 domain-containing protein n=1 Tax=Paenibacillus vietnamensis TaxID=2590547 RepID=UPI001CD0F5F2|nr:DUF4163 domain-containing protein [Paenibacillus vietnamensis]MCA0753638.1 DUF4163 domain-containing protein [Paenibacillus vietnamensis]
MRMLLLFIVISLAAAGYPAGLRCEAYAAGAAPAGRASLSQTAGLAVAHAVPLRSPDKRVSYSEDSVLVQLDGLQNRDAQAKINSALQAHAKEELAEALAAVEQNLTERQADKDRWAELYGAEDETFFYGTIVNRYQVTYLNPHIVSIVSDGFFSMMPQAHPIKKRAAFVFDLRTGERLRVKDALRAGPDTEEKLSRIVREQIAKGRLRPEGTGETLHEPGSFMSEPDSVQFWVRETEDGKALTLFRDAIYAIGFYELDLPEAVLGELADPQSPIWRK